MAKQSYPIETRTIRATGAIAANRFVLKTAAQAGAAANTIGVSRAAAASGELVSIDKEGTTVVETGGVFAAGDALETDASGRAVVQAAGPNVAQALEASTAAGQFIEAKLLQNIA